MPMKKIYFAPLEGFTDAVYRRVHHACFGGADKYFMPFISPSQSLSFTSRQQADIDPRENAGVPAVPQVLAKNADYFLDMTRLLRDAGYTEVNLNLGCPSGTVTAKGKGAGMLRDLDALARFLDDVYGKAVLPVSLKTRAGYDDPAEWPALLRLFARYPVHEWILHPRTCREFYSGAPHWDFFREAAQTVSFPVVYNGNLFCPEDVSALSAVCAQGEGWMLGRGLLTNPALARALRGGEGLTMENLRAFHDRLYREYLKTWPEHAVVGRMHGLMSYMILAVKCPAPIRRALRKATTAEEYTDAAARLFSEGTLEEKPRFTPPEERESPDSLAVF